MDFTLLPPGARFAAAKKALRPLHSEIRLVMAARPEQGIRAAHIGTALSGALVQRFIAGAQRDAEATRTNHLTRLQDAWSTALSQAVANWGQDAVDKAVAALDANNAR